MTDLGLPSGGNLDIVLTRVYARAFQQRYWFFAVTSVTLVMKIKLIWGKISAQISDKNCFWRWIFVSIFQPLHS